MKKNSLTTAVVAGLAGVAGFAGLASAVNLNPDGLGQVLVFPYYTVNKSQDTLMSVVNTTDIGKAVKVRFLEGYNSRECLDFNLFLSAYDVWTATLFDLGRTDPDSTDAFGPAITTADQSCTLPWFVNGASSDGTFLGKNYIAFRGTQFQGALTDGGPSDISRCREGHFEMINMGDIIPGTTLDAQITHSDTGTPNTGKPTCGAYVSNANFAAIKADIAFPTTENGSGSGIYGSGQIVNVGEGTFFGYNADAIEGFYTNQGDNLYSVSGSLQPSLSQAANELNGSATAYVFQSGGLLTSNYGDGIDAVSAVFMANNLYNEYTVDPAIGSQTDWVVTFPTKRYYVDDQIVGAAVQPFVELFDGGSCVEVGIEVFDREEGSATPGGCDVSPCPPGPAPNQICNETNVLSFAATTQMVSGVLGSDLVKSIKPYGTAGHAILHLSTGDAPAGHALRAAGNGNVFHGLPATGFAAQNVVNANVTDGVLANYSGLFRHRISRDCRIGNGPDAVACS